MIRRQILEIVGWETPRRSATTIWGRFWRRISRQATTWSRRGIRHLDRSIPRPSITSATRQVISSIVSSQSPVVDW